jgi:hypothetical protein
VAFEAVLPLEEFPQALEGTPCSGRSPPVGTDRQCSRGPGSGSLSEIPNIWLDFVAPPGAEFVLLADFLVLVSELLQLSIG